MRRQDPSNPKELAYDMRIDQAEAQRAEADTAQAHNLDRTLSVDRGGVNFRRPCHTTPTVRCQTPTSLVSKWP